MALLKWGQLVVLSAVDCACVASVFAAQLQEAASGGSGTVTISGLDGTQYPVNFSGGERVAGSGF